jgi:hypothetical protein
MTFISRARFAALAVAERASCVSKGIWWIPAAILCGTVPFLLSWQLGVTGQAYVSALLLALICLGCARSGRWLQGVAVIVVTFVSHCVLVTYASSLDPQGTSAILPGAHAYWERQLTWIRTGIDPEYRTGEWLGAHAQLAAACSVFTITSLGWLTFLEGFKEVDLMNYYAGRLWASSGHVETALAGWHIWSMLRGAGFALLTMTLIMLVVQWFQTKRFRVAWPRLIAGVALLIVDVIVKSQTMPAVREVLSAHLHIPH